MQTQQEWPGYPEPKIVERARAIFNEKNLDPYFEFDMTARRVPVLGETRKASIGARSRELYFDQAREELQRFGLAGGRGIPSI